MAERALPDLKSRISLDVSDFPKAEKQAKSMGQTLGLAFTGSKKGAEDFEKGLKSATGVLGESAEGVEGLVGKLGNLAGLAGLGGAGVAALGLTAILGTGLEVVKSSVEGYVRFGEQVLNFQRVTGQSAEASSRMIDVFGQLGISAEQGDKAMFQLAKRVEDVGGKVPKTGKTLEDLGVLIAKTSTGSIDLTKTLGSVADAYNASGSAAERDAIVYAAFGKAGAAMIPVLEQGSAGLNAMSNAAQRVFDQEQLEQVHQYNIEMAKAGQQIDQFKDNLGGSVLPILGGLTQSFNDAGAASSYVDRTLASQNRQAATSRGEYRQLAEEGKRLADQQKADALAAQEHSAAMKQLDDAVRQAAADQDALYTSDQSLISATISKERADQSVTNTLKQLGDETLKDSEYADKHAASIHAIEAAQDKYTKAVAAFGPTSDQATAAQDALNAKIDAGKNLDQQYGDQAANLQRIQLDVKDAMVAAANAAVALAEKQATAASASLTAGQKADIFRQALVDEEKQLAPDSPLRVALDAYIAQLDNIPREVITHIGVTGSEAAIAAGYVNPGRASGGPVIPGGVYTVGEEGPETLIMYGGAGGGYVMPNVSKGDGRITNNYYISGAGVNPEMIAMAIDRRTAKLFQ